MTRDRGTGVVLGLLVCAVVIAGNVHRGNPHLLSVYPDLAALVIAPVVIYLLARRRRRRGDAPEVVRGFGVRTGAVAGVVFAIGLGLFTVLYGTGPWPLWVFAGATAFGSVLLLSTAAAYAAARGRSMATSH
jgi:hypothetical protein